MRSITLDPGATQESLVVEITDDRILENVETFSVGISVLDEDTRVQPNTTVVSIQDDDSKYFQRLWNCANYLTKQSAVEDKLYFAAPGS